jgi:hypothetical protein
VEPIVWNRRTGNIVGGHQRYKVLVALGYDEVDCVVLDIDENKEKALNVALNKITGEFDIPLLTDLLKDIGAGGFDVSLTGFDAAELDALFRDGVAAGIKEDDFDEPLPETPVSRGDIWLSGVIASYAPRRDQARNLARLMDGKRAISSLPTHGQRGLQGQGGQAQKRRHGECQFHDFLLAGTAACTTRWRPRQHQCFPRRPGNGQLQDGVCRGGSSATRPASGSRTHRSWAGATTSTATSLSTGLETDLRTNWYADANSSQRGALIGRLGARITRR